MNYLVLHIDKDFISGTVCVGNATSVPITQGNDNMLWLYFFNNPHQDRVSFGRENRIHYNERKVNYYGGFTEKITDDTETFTIRGIKKPIIELLEYSDLIKLIQSSYERVTRESSESIPTLITFSLSISDLSKQTLVDYLSKKGFDIKSYTIPLAELTCYSLHSKKKFSIANGSSVIFLSATNATLHIMKMVFSENYFMIDGEVESFKGKGIDPRKRALVKFVVNELNKSTGALSSSDEIEDECVRKEQQSDEWLKRLDAQSSNRPISINESLSVMQSTKLQVLVRKEHIDKDTGHYVNELADIFDFFKSKHFTGDVAGLFLLGDCFLSSLVNKKFKNYVSEDKLFVFGNKDIPEILASYPKIDFKRYIDQESRIKALAEAEELKQIEQRTLEDRLRKEQEMLQNKEALEKQAELNKIEAQQKYERAVELELEGKLEDAKVNIEQALLLDKTSKQISLHHANLLEKIRIRNEKNELYKSYLAKAEKYKVQNKLEEALVEYEAAKLVYDNADILSSIIEIRRIITNESIRIKKFSKLFTEARLMLRAGKFSEVEESIKELSVLDKDNEELKLFVLEFDLTKATRDSELKSQGIPVLKSLPPTFIPGKSGKSGKFSTITSPVSNRDIPIDIQPDVKLPPVKRLPNKVVPTYQNPLLKKPKTVVDDSVTFVQLWNTYIIFINKILDKAKVKHFDRVEIERGLNYVANKEYTSLALKKLVTVLSQYTSCLTTAEIMEFKSIEVKLLQAYSLLNKSV